MCINFMPGARRGQKEVLGSLELELQMVVSCHVVAGNQIWVLEEKPVYLTCSVSTVFHHSFGDQIISDMLLIRYLHYNSQQQQSYS